jgi:hypothetical protein
MEESVTKSDLLKILNQYDDNIDVQILTRDDDGDDSYESINSVIIVEDHNIRFLVLTSTVPG